ncbi:hypothetical protein SLEP1_g47590 [Rubroshorea leprosula]|uniref:Uncharacterized protein n=1 Tax=Rubroshorea leprosula TaxID=152421 RepID=A0AAV5LQZ3_9ROSI|nr:hypothetical protein SLEP1_g47590 [Rubroshorea leprosula]
MARSCCSCYRYFSKAALFMLVVSTSLEATTALWASFLAYSNYAQKYPIITILITHGIFLSGLLTLWLIPTRNIGINFLALGLLTLGRAGRRIIYSFLKRQVKLQLDQDYEKEKEHEKDKKKKHERRVKKRTKFCSCIRQKPEEDEKKKPEEDEKKKPEEDEKEKHEKRVQECIKVWFWIGYFPGFITAVIISSRSWKLKFMIGAIAMGIGYVSFCFGLMYYKSETQTTNTLVSQDNQSRIKWQSWQHLKLFPLWTPFLAYYVIQASGATFFMQQVDILGKGVKFLSPQICMVLVRSITNFLTKRVFNLECFPNENWKHHVRLTSGIVFSFCCCIASWHVEGCRLHLIKTSESTMNISWLVPQFFFLGFSSGFVGGGLKNFFFYLVPESRTDLGFAFNKLVEGMAKYIGVVFILVFRSWIREAINTSRLDNYYRTLACLNLVALFLFTYLSNSFDWKIDLKRTDEERRGDNGDATSSDENVEEVNEALSVIPLSPTDRSAK